MTDRKLATLTAAGWRSSREEGVGGSAKRYFHPAEHIVAGSKSGMKSSRDSYLWPRLLPIESVPGVCGRVLDGRRKVY